jgi:hypothetical protein
MGFLLLHPSFAGFNGSLQPLNFHPMKAKTSEINMAQMIKKRHYVPALENKLNGVSITCPQHRLVSSYSSEPLWLLGQPVLTLP